MRHERRATAILPVAEEDVVTLGSDQRHRFTTEMSRQPRDEVDIDEIASGLSADVLRTGAVGAWVSARNGSGTMSG